MPMAYVSPGAPFALRMPSSTILPGATASRGAYVCQEGGNGAGVCTGGGAVVGTTVGTTVTTTVTTTGGGEVG
jgi:hypothetical protein